MRIKTHQELRDIYQMPKGRAITKQLDYLDQHAKKFISLSPFLMMATVGKNNQSDATPRGGKPGFVHCLDAKNLLIPDWPGNNRLDSLENIIHHPTVGLLFIIPGFNETLRVNGNVEIIVDKQMQDQFIEQGRTPISLLKISVEEVYLHCAKAFMRAKLWSAESIQQRETLPTIGQMITDQTNGNSADKSKPETQEEMEQRYLKALY